MGLNVIIINFLKRWKRKDWLNGFGGVIEVLNGDNENEII